MTNKIMFLGILGNGVPSGEIKAKMFEFHNSYVGKSPYTTKHENPKTMCGSCIQRVKANCWKVYHSDLYRWEYKEIEFTGKLGMFNAPKYKLTQEQLTQRVVRRKDYE
tara:strand:- start:511 stop:834 length:324 start_codon:yes stop_codon:yes gene_type:complete